MLTAAAAGHLDSGARRGAIRRAWGRGHACATRGLSLSPPLSHNQDARRSRCGCGADLAASVWLRHTRERRGAWPGGRRIMDTAPLTGAGPGLEGGAAGASARGAQWGGVGGGGGCLSLAVLAYLWTGSRPSAGGRDWASAAPLSGCLVQGSGERVHGIARPLASRLPRQSSRQSARRCVSLSGLAVAVSHTCHVPCCLTILAAEPRALSRGRAGP